VSRLRWIGIVLVVGMLTAAGAAWAASLTITPQKLTAFSYCIVRASNADNGARQDAPTNNFGGDTDMRVRSQSGTNNRRSFVSFDLSSCNAQTTANVIAATLSLYITTAPGASRTYEARPVSASWIETGTGSITWNNQPAAGSVTSTTTTGTTANVRIAWTVTSDVQNWLDGSATNYGIRISDATEGSATSRETRFATKESGTASQRPQLTIQYYAR
jgi:hypothetical protein